MQRPRQFQRRVKLVYGDPTGGGLGSGPTVPFTLDSFAGDGPRISFTVERTNRGISDRAFIDVYNMPREFRRGLRVDLEQQWKDRREIQEEVSDPRERARRLGRVADSFRFNLFTGYGPDERQLVLLMRGDMINVVPETRRGGVDTITRIELGDTLLAMRDSYMREVYGTGATVTNVLRGAIAAANLEIDEGSEKLISIVAPNAVVTKLENGFVARGRVGDTISELVDLFGLQWWIRDGTIYFVPQGATLTDFSIGLREGRDLLDWNETNSYGDVRGRALLNANIVPGRGLLLQRLDGGRFDEVGHRVNEVRYRGDTRGSQWFAQFQATAISNSLLAPAIEFESSEFTFQDQLDTLERQFQ